MGTTERTAVWLAALFGFVGYLPDGLPNYGFRPFQERLKLVESLGR